MGGTSSKAARQFPKSTSKTKWAGARTPSSGEGATPMPTQPPPPKAHSASETRTEAIEHDSRDPHFLAKLNRLGPVRVDHSIRTYKPAAELAQHVYDTRRQSEIEARSNRASYNHILAASLSDLLDECKSAVSAGDIEKISLRYDIDHARLQSLRALVNNPTIDPATVRRTVNEEGEEKMTMNVMWSEAK